jgi:hypothetical protein
VRKLTLTQSVFVQLAQSGRLTLSALLQHSDRTPVHTRNALVGLLKAQLILFSTDDSDVTFYEPNWEVAYILTIRSGSLIRLVEERYDERAAEVFQTVLSSGVVRVADLRKTHVVEAAKYDSPLSQRSNGDGDAQANGVDESLAHWKPGQFAAVKDLYATLQLLLQSGLVEVVGSRAFMPEHELKEEAEQLVLESGAFSKGVSGKKAKKSFRTAADDLRRQWRDEAHQYFYEKGKNKGKKRGRDPFDDEDEYQHQAKRQKSDAPAANGVPSQLCGWYQQNQDALDVSLARAQQGEDVLND